MWKPNKTVSISQKFESYKGYLSIPNQSMKDSVGSLVRLDNV